jgi:hypothetical protein
VQEPQGTFEGPGQDPGANGSEQREPEVMTADRFLQLHRTKQGFGLSARPGAERIPREIDGEVAYDVRQGNPFKRYSNLDFELNKPPIRISGKGLKAGILKPNLLRIVLEERDFHLSVTGFDPKRDLKIKTTTFLDTSL